MTGIGRYTENGTTEDGWNVFVEPGTKLPPKLNCIRVNKFTEASRKLSAAGRKEVGGLGSLVMALALAMMW
jgi:hypothetical protein